MRAGSNWRHLNGLSLGMMGDPVRCLPKVVHPDVAALKLQHNLLRCYDNVIRPHRALKCGRETRTPAMQAGLVNAPMNGSDIFTAPAALYAFHVAVVRVPVAVQLMHTKALFMTVWCPDSRSVESNCGIPRG